MRKITAFYAWQSDTPRNFNQALIEIALRDAAKRITEDSSLRVEVNVDSILIPKRSRNSTDHGYHTEEDCPIVPSTHAERMRPLSNQDGCLHFEGVLDLERWSLMPLFTSSSSAPAARWGDVGLSLRLPQYAGGRLEDGIKVRT